MGGGCRRVIAFHETFVRDVKHSVWNGGSNRGRRDRRVQAMSKS